MPVVVKRRPGYVKEPAGLRELVSCPAQVFRSSRWFLSHRRVTKTQPRGRLRAAQLEDCRPPGQHSLVL